MGPEAGDRADGESEDSAGMSGATARALTALLVGHARVMIDARTGMAAIDELEVPETEAATRR